MTRTVVIGVGNPILSDDSVGIRIARAVQDALVDEARVFEARGGAAARHGVGGASEMDRVVVAEMDRVVVTEVYAGGLRLMETLSGYDRAFLIDAVETGEAPPGTVHRFARQDLRALRNVSGVHDTSLGMALQVADRLSIPLPTDIRIWGVEIAEGMEFGEELTPAVAAAVPRVVDDVLGALKC